MIDSDEYLTPSWVFDRLDIHFDLDPASSLMGDSVPTKHRFTMRDDGLSQHWEGTVWCNPPYSDVTPWVTRMVKHQNGILLVPIVKSAWLHVAVSSSDRMVIPKPWIAFLRADREAHISCPTAFFSFGEAATIALKAFPGTHLQVA